MTKVQEITCPKCEASWPYVSEQYITIEKLGHCYSCFIQDVVQIRDARAEEVDYQIDNCPTCFRAPDTRASCVPCEGKGWVVIGKEEEKLIELL